MRWTTAAVIAVGLLGGCSHTQSMAPVGGTGAALMYPLTDAQADRVLATAMASEFSGSPISRVEFPNKGYTATMRFLLDSHQITAVRVPARGKAPEPSAAGEALVEGFYFEVNDAGTMLISGRNRASKVYERIVHEAGLLTKPLTQGR
ncbi:hypothetical protein CCO03_13510 [Comamonas serinivorans]|uniref:Uncharacterized protein n=1 Tax=Comamonas serinivorans TaxID=1082851 RepID=A0A1Y0EPK3_9BURK|nr:hypothetical protein [Comamonas serinivorans]ARU05563.1 hypothetical protein CCO03_13510 [Comamonas serinivorans]